MTAGAVGYAGGGVLYGMDQYVNLARGTSIHLPLLLGVGAGVGMLVSNVSHEYLLPYIHVSERLQHPVATSLNIGMNFVAEAES